MIQPHDVKAAATWESGGPNYDRISQAISDAIEHCVIRLAPKPGERILNIERSSKEYDTLLAKAGFRLTRIVPSASAVSIVEAVPA